MESSPTWRLLVSPAKGTFIRDQAAGEATTLPPDSPVGMVRSLRDETPIVASHGGTIVEWLVEDGDLVSPGQPLLRLHPEGVSA
jgi:[acyl-carrier-protein] S-malonyltransferase